MNQETGAPMAIIDMRDYGPAARLYWWTVTSLGCLAFVLSPLLVKMNMHV